jgi:hypothetical protein
VVLPACIRRGLGKTSGHFNALGHDESAWAASLAEKTRAKNESIANLALFQYSIAPHLTDPSVADATETSIRYGVHLYTIVEAGWIVMQQGYRKLHSMPWDATALAAAISDYDAAYAEYRAFGLAEIYAASLYHPYYLCLGTSCNCAFDPAPGTVPDGIGATVDQFRNTSV